MCPPCSEAGVLHDHPVAFGHGFYVGASKYNLKAAFVTADSTGTRGPEEGYEGRLDGIHALYLVYVCRVDGAGESAKEERAGWERGGDRVSMETGVGLAIGLHKEVQEQ
jgi:hypothetical protein